jgi:hypothetical protein
MQIIWQKIRQFDPDLLNQELDLVVDHKQAVLDFSSSLISKVQVIVEIEGRLPELTGRVTKGGCGNDGENRKRRKELTSQIPPSPQEWWSWSASATGSDTRARGGGPPFSRGTPVPPPRDHRAQRRGEEVGDPPHDGESYQHY